MTVLPAASAAATPPQGIASGKFQGETTTTTPLPWRDSAGQIRGSTRARYRRRTGRSRWLRKLPGRLRRASCRLRRAWRRSGRRGRRRVRRRRGGGCRRVPHCERRRQPSASARAAATARSMSASRRLTVAGDNRAGSRRIERIAHGEPRARSKISSPAMTSGTFAACGAVARLPGFDDRAGPVAIVRQRPVGVGFVAERREESRIRGRGWLARALELSTLDSRLRSCVRRGACATVLIASNACNELLFELLPVSLPTSMRKAWRRKLSGPVFSSSRRTR